MSQKPKKVSLLPFIYFFERQVANGQTNIKNRVTAHIILKKLNDILKYVVKQLLILN